MCNFLRTSQPALPRGRPSVHSRPQCTRAPLSPQLRQPLLLLDLRMTAILTGVRWRVMVVFTGSFRMAGDTEHPSLGLLPTLTHPASKTRGLLRPSASLYPLRDFVSPPWVQTA